MSNVSTSFMLDFHASHPTSISTAIDFEWRRRKHTKGATATSVNAHVRKDKSASARHLAVHQSEYLASESLAMCSGTSFGASWCRNSRPAHSVSEFGIDCGAGGEFAKEIGARLINLGQAPSKAAVRIGLSDGHAR
jgi:hypothetical protein